MDKYEWLRNLQEQIDNEAETQRRIILTDSANDYVVRTLNLNMEYDGTEDSVEALKLNEAFGKYDTEEGAIGRDNRYMTIGGKIDRMRELAKAGNLFIVIPPKEDDSKDNEKLIVCQVTLDGEGKPVASSLGDVNELPRPAKTFWARVVSLIEMIGKWFGDLRKTEVQKETDKRIEEFKKRRLGELLMEEMNEKEDDDEFVKKAADKITLELIWYTKLVKDREFAMKLGMGMGDDSVEPDDNLENIASLFTEGEDKEKFIRYYNNIREYIKTHSKKDYTPLLDSVRDGKVKEIEKRERTDAPEGSVLEKDTAEIKERMGKLGSGSRKYNHELKQINFFPDIVDRWIEESGVPEKYRVLTKALIVKKYTEHNRNNKDFLSELAGGSDKQQNILSDVIREAVDDVVSMKNEMSEQEFSDAMAENIADGLKTVNNLAGRCRSGDKSIYAYAEIINSMLNQIENHEDAALQRRILNCIDTSESRRMEEMALQSSMYLSGLEEAALRYYVMNDEKYYGRAHEIIGGNNARKMILGAIAENILQQEPSQRKKMLDNSVNNRESISNLMKKIENTPTFNRLVNMENIELLEVMSKRENLQKIYLKALGEIRPERKSETGNEIKRKDKPQLKRGV